MNQRRQTGECGVRQARRRRVRRGLAGAALVAALAALAAPAAGAVELLPAGRRLFDSPVADPTAPASTVRVLGSVDDRTYAEVNIGDEFGLISWGDGAWQLGVAAGIAARFDLSSELRDFEAVDYTLVVPLDTRLGRLSVRAAYQHTSSHLGDDYLERTQKVAPKRSVDELRLTGSLAFAPGAGMTTRLYAGAGYAFNVLPDDAGAVRCQGGAELRWRALFVAGDLQLLERSGWEPAFTARAGWELAGAAAALCLFAEYGSGPAPYLAFIDRQESRWALGLALRR